MTPEQREWFDHHRTAQYGRCKGCDAARRVRSEGSGRNVRSWIECPNSCPQPGKGEYRRG